MSSDLRRETFDQMSQRSHRQNDVGHALALARFERGQRLTVQERSVLTHWSMWGSDSYPLRKLGRVWAIEHSCYRGGPLFKSKREAVCAWEIYIAILISLSGLEKQSEVSP